MICFLKFASIIFAIFSLHVNCLQRLEQPTRATEISIGLKTLLQDINNPIRLTAMVCWDIEFAQSFVVDFHATSIGRRQYMLGIVPDVPDRFPYYATEEHQEMIVVDLNCKDNLVNLLNQTQNQMETHYKWVFISTGIDAVEVMDATILNLLADSPVMPRSEIYYISKNTDGEIIFKQVYRTSMSQPLQLELFGIYSGKHFHDYGRERTVVSRRKDLNGIELRACMVVTNNDTLNHLTDYRDKHIDTITKVNYALTNHLISYVNATVRYSVVSTWGYRNKTTGEWDGMIGELVNNISDIGASPLFFTSDRVSIIQYIAMPSPTTSAFIFRAPKLSYTDNVFLLPFDNLVWLCLMALVLVTAIFMTGAIFAEWKVPLAPLDLSDAGLLRPSVGDVFLLIYGATCQQGSAVAPRSTTARVIMVVAFIILMFLYTSYSANIVALLQSPSTKIRTLKDLYDSRLKLGVDDTIYNHYYFTVETEPVRKAIYEQKIRNKDGTTNFMSLRQGIQRMREGLYAFHVERSVGYQLISETFYEDEKCGLQGIKFFQMTDPWYAIQKNSSYKELFKTGMMRMHEHGLQDRENSRLYTKQPKCAGAGGHFVTASLVDTGPAMLVLLWGFGFAVLLLFVEIALDRFKLKKRHHQVARNTAKIA